jgi:hypothetical protein
MPLPTVTCRHLTWFNLPVAALLLLLQRMSALRLATAATETVIASPIGQVLRAVFTAAALGALHSRAGATTFIISTPRPISGTVGQPLTAVTFTYTGTPSNPASFQFSGTLPPGLGFTPAPIGSLIRSGTPVISGTPTQAGSFTIQVQGYNPEGLTNNIRQPITFNIGGGGGTVVAPAFTTQPAAQTIASGGTVVFQAAATGATGYQWRRNGGNLPGATGATLILSEAAPSHAGDYTVVATNGAGALTSNVATLAVIEREGFGRLINLSILTDIPAPGENFALGYVVGGRGTSGPKPLVIRAAGPSLGALGVPGTLNDPKIELFAAAKTGENDNWGGGAALSEAMAAVGAFAYTAPNSLDAAAVVEIAASNGAPSNNSVRVSAAGSGTGVVIAEIYDATPAATFGLATPRLVNVSVLKHIGQGLTAGFVVRGPGALTVLVRAIGPTLGEPPFGVDGVVPDPRLTLFGEGSRLVAENDDWGGDAALAAAFGAVGAFSLPPNARDAAVLVTLPPGSYTVEVKGAGASSGVALVEVYEVP